MPWGIQMTSIPKIDDEGAVIEKFQRICSAFGLRSESEPGWRLVSSADGG